MAVTPTAIEIQQQADAFRRGFNSVQLATRSPDNTADISYAPCLIDTEGNALVFTSELARHTRNMLANPGVSLMWIEDESNCRNIFARQRLIVAATAHELDPGHTDYNDLLNQMQETLGSTIGVLRQLPDFHLFRLTLRKGTYVMGFAQAHTVTGNQLNVLP